MPAQIYNMRRHLRGDEFKGFSIKITAPYDFTGAVFIFEFREAAGRKFLLGRRWSTDQVPSVLSWDPVENRLTVLRHIPELESRTWYYDMQVVWPDILDPNGKPRTLTWLKGTWEIYEDTAV